MVWIEKNGQTEKSIRRRMCRLDMLIGTFLTFFVIVCFVLLLGVGCASAATIVVNQTSPACTTGDEYCNTIQEALYMAEEGDTIIVCPCIYKENIVVDTSVCIQSYAGASDTVIEAKDNRKNIVIIRANKVTISGFTIRNSKAEGIYLKFANNCNLSGNNIHSVRNGIHLDSSTNNKISRNTINLNDNKGIYMVYSHNNSILNNAANANKQSDGIDLSSSNNNIIIGNNASNNMEEGIYLHYSNNNSLRENIANSNKQYHGIELYSSKNNIISDNNASNNFQCGIALFESSNNNTITGNTANLNNNDGIYLESSHINSILNNSANSNKEYHGIELSTSNNNFILDNNASNNLQDGIRLEGSNNNVIRDNTAISNKQYHGIELNASNNNDIIGNNASNNFHCGIALFESSNNNTIKGNNANSNKQFDGIDLRSSNNNIIIGNNASNNMQDGIYLHYSNNNYIKGNIANYNKQFRGISVSSSNNTVIEGNNASNNLLTGIRLDESNNATIIGNTANYNKQFYGISVSSSNNTVIEGNNAFNNIVNGIMLTGSNINCVRRNIVQSNNDDGISLMSSNYNNISKNVAQFNFQSGISFSSSNDSTITGNIIYSNSNNGIYLDESEKNTISNNIISSNNRDGIFLVNTENNDIVDNVISSNRLRGLEIQTSKTNKVLNNSINSNSAEGIILFDSTLITIFGNTISSNYLEGIEINADSYLNEIYHNNIINNEVEDDTIRIWDDEIVSLNLWYNESLEEGNYWSDYDGIDVGGDDIGDTDIPHPEEGYDSRPLMDRDGWLTMSVWPHYLDFGVVYQGTPIKRNFTIMNYGNSKLNIFLIKSDLAITTSGVERPIQRESSEIFSVSLDAEMLEGFVSKNIAIISDDPKTPYKNISIFGFVKIPVHDVRITAIDFDSRIIKGQMDVFNVGISNHGSFDEHNLIVEFKDDGEVMGNRTIPELLAGENETVSYHWDTTDAASGVHEIAIETRLPNKDLLDSIKVKVNVLPDSEATTLIVTNFDRFSEHWGKNKSNMLEKKLIKLSYSPCVDGVIINVGEDTNCSHAYELWDLNLQDPQSANEVAKHVKKLIDEKRNEYTGIRYIIIVGDDRIIPYYRISDNTDKPFRPERWQTVDDYHKVNIDSAIGSAFHNKMFLTDNIYATDRSMEWETADVIIPELFVPDVPVGRLVESLEDISAVIAAFYQKEYVNPDKIFVTGYDFLSDSASDCSSTLENRTKGTTTNVISQKEVTEKYFDDIKDELLNTSNDIVLLFQHAEHDLFNIPKYQVGSEKITSQIISSATGLNGSIVCSLGCHSGLNVPPNASTDDFDLAQAFAQKGVLAYIAPTSYSIGLKRTIGAHELLITYFTQYLCEGMDVGTALTRAKQEYWATNYDISYIDEHVLETTTLYGLPMARINIPHPNTSYNGPEMKIMSFERGKPDILVIRPTYTRINISTMLSLPKTYYKSESGELFLGPTAPIQPKEIRIFYPTPTRMLHGAVLTSAKYTVKSIIPLIDAYMQSPASIGKSGSSVIDNWCPAQIFKLKSLCYPRAPMESRQYLIIVTGQYKGPTRVTTSLVGREERLYDELAFQLYYASPDAETTPPVINVSHRHNHNVTISVNASDESGIQRVLVTFTDGEGEWRSKDLNKKGELWTCAIPINDISEFFVQAVDNNGNVAVGNVFL